jgi:hypothetical protein
MAAFRYNVRFLAWKLETEAEGLEADGTGLVVLWMCVAGNDGQGV